MTVAHAFQGAESSSAAPLARMVLGLAGYELSLAVRRGESLLVTTVIPLALLAFFGTVPLVPTGGRPAVEFLLPGILALAVMSNGLVSLGIATAFERQYGVLKRLGGSPLPRVGLLAGKLLAIVIIQLAQVVLLGLAAAVLFGWRPSSTALAGLGVLLLGTCVFSALGLLLAGTLRAEATLALANGLYLALLLLGDMVVPLELLPAPLAAVARLLPAAALAATLRAVLDPASGAVGWSLLVLAGWGLGAGLAAARWFRWE